MATDKKRVTISMDHDIFDRMNEWAEKEDRTFSQQAVRIFKEALERCQQDVNDKQKERSQ